MEQSRFVEIHNRVLFECKPSFIFPKFVDNLPDDIKNCDKIDGFQKRFKLYLMEKCFYSAEKFLSLDH